jgi:dynein heavy chain
MLKGEWAFLQNCHLARSWMPALEELVLNLNDEETKVHPDFRLWLTSMPASYFPVSVLQRGVKLTNEPPKGMRANLLRSYTNVVDEKQFEESSKPEAWKKLLFGLTFFFSIIQNRKKFGPLGWNKLYEFNDSDLETSITNTALFLEEQDQIPWDALTYVCGEINFGGRVTDDWDRRCLMTNLARFLSPQILDDDYKFSPSGLYFAPPEGPLSDYTTYLNTLPRTADTEIYGMHENANISFQLKESQIVLDNIISIQPREANTGSDGKSTDDVVLELAASLEKRLPKMLRKTDAGPDTFTMRGEVMDSVSIVLLQEIVRFNKLLSVMQKTLSDLQKAIRGEVVMSPALDKMFTSVLISKVPDLWTKASYSSLKALAPWFEDLHERVDFMTRWIKQGEPNSFWMSAFFFPQGFLTGVLQNYARKCMVPINELSFSYKLLNHSDSKLVTAKPEWGVHVHGLFFDAGDWDPVNKVICDPKVGDLNPVAPVIHFIPTENYQPNPDDYECPVYKTTDRAGVLSTTGMSTNFVVSVYLPNNKTPAYWVLKGAALMLTLS